MVDTVKISELPAVSLSSLTDIFPIVQGGVTYKESLTQSRSIIAPLTTKGDLLSFSTLNVRFPVGTDGQILSSDSTQSSGLRWITASTGTVSSVSGTSNRITVTNPTTTPVIDISSAYVGQTSITTLGTISTGLWQAAPVGILYGGTGKTTSSDAFNALSPLTTKGDLLSFSTLNTRLGVGTDGQLLVADSTQAIGIKWATTGINWKGAWNSSTTYHINDAVSNEGNSYISTDTNINSNPSVLSGNTIGNIIPTNTNSSGPFELATDFTPATNMLAIGVRFYKESGEASGHTGNLWDASGGGAGTLLNSVVFSSETSFGWQTQNFATPTLLIGGHTYRISYNIHNQWGNTFPFFPITTPDGFVTDNSSYFSSTPGTYPNTSPSAGSYFADVIYGPTSDWQIIAEGSSPINSIIPTVDNLYDLGSANYRFRNLYLGTNQFIDGYIQFNANTANTYLALDSNKRTISVTPPVGTSGRISVTNPLTAPIIDLVNTAVTAGSYTNSNITVDASGRITAASNGSSGSGTVTNVSVTPSNGVTASVANPTTTPNISIGLGNITPTSIALQSGDLILSNAHALKGSSNTGNTAEFQVWSVAGNAYRTWMVMNNVSGPGSTPIVTLQPPSDGQLNINASIFNGSLGSTIASASTVNLETATGNFLTISGTTTISTITLSQGHSREVIFSGSLTLTNSSTLICPTGANIITKSGDAVTFYGSTGSAVIITKYQRVDGSSLTDGTTLVTNTGSAITVAVESYKCYQLTMNAATPVITFSASTSGISNSIFITLIQDSSGNRAPTFSGVTFADNFLPIISQGAGAKTFLEAKWDGTVWALTQYGDASVAEAGTNTNFYFGEDSFNSGSASNVDFNAKNLHTVTLNSATPVLTIIDGPTGNSLYGFLNLVQDGTGGRLPTFSGNIVYASGVAPTIAQAAGSITSLSFVWNGIGKWFIFANAQSQSTVTSNSATGVSVAANTNVDITSITLQPGWQYDLNANITWNAAALTAPLQFLNFYGDASGNNQTGIDSLSNVWQDPLGPTVSLAKIISLPTYPLTVTGSPRTVYLKAFCALTSGTNTVDGKIIARRVAPA